MSAKVDPTSSYTTGGIALRVIGVLELLYHDKVEVPTEELAYLLLKKKCDFDISAVCPPLHPFLTKFNKTWCEHCVTVGHPNTAGPISL